jgi:hypothetical protein
LSELDARAFPAFTTQRHKRSVHANLLAINAAFDEDDHALAIFLRDGGNSFLN